MRNFVLIFIFTATLPIALSCGKKDEKGDSGNGATPPALTSFEQITGDWTGIYVALSDGKPFGDWQPINASFEVDGKFKMTLENDNAASVAGEWSQFQGTSMIWKITESTISPLGLKNQVVQPDYALEGNGLRIKSNQFEIRLPRKRNQDASTGGGAKESLGPGAWSCMGLGTDRESKIIIGDNHEFSLSTIRQGERAFVARGVSALRSETSMILTPQTVSDQIADQSYFELRVLNGNVVLIYIKSASSETVLGKCWK
jgi:hypothetical protein